MPGPTPAPLNEYDPNQVFFTFNLVGISGFQVGTMIEIDYVKAFFSYKADVSGSGTRTKSSDYSAKITITLNQRSESNQVLSTFSNIDRATGTSFGPLQIKDNTGSDLCIAASAWIVKPAKIGYNAESDTRVWEFMTDNLVQNQGN